MKTVDGIQYRARAPIYFLFSTILIQSAAFATLVLTYPRVHPLIAFAAAEALIFCLAKLIFTLPRSWTGLNILLTPALFFSIMSQIPSAVWLIPLGAIGVTYLPTFWTRVPYYPTSVETYQAILELLPTDRPFKFIDMGSGFGTLLFFLSKRLPMGSFEGVEIGPLPYLVSLFRATLSGEKNIKISRRNFWKLSLEPYDFVYAFLAPGPMPKLWEKAKCEMRAGTTLIINSFEVPATPQKIIEIGDKRQCRILIYKP